MKLRFPILLLILAVAAPDMSLADDEGLPLPLPGRRPASRPATRPAPANPTAVATLVYHGDDKPAKPSPDAPAPPVPKPSVNGIIPVFNRDVSDPIGASGGGSRPVSGEAAPDEPPAPDTTGADAILRLQLRGVIRLEDGKAIATVQTEQLEWTLKPTTPFNKRAKLGTERLEVRARLRSWRRELTEAQLQELGRNKRLVLPVSEPFTAVELLKGSTVNLTFLPVQVWEVITGSGSGGPR